MKGTVLIVDDEPDIIRVLERRLDSQGYRVLTAENGETALQVYQRERPDVVLLDVHIPDLDGIEILRTLKDINPQVGVIVMTGDPYAARAKLALQEGACDFLRKPIEMDYLDKTVAANVFIRRDGGR